LQTEAGPPGKGIRCKKSKESKESPFVAAYASRSQHGGNDQEKREEHRGEVPEFRRKLGQLRVEGGTFCEREKRLMQEEVSTTTLMVGTGSWHPRAADTSRREESINGEGRKKKSAKRKRRKGKNINPDKKTRSLGVGRLPPEKGAGLKEIFARRYSFFLPEKELREKIQWRKKTNVKDSICILLRHLFWSTKNEKHEDSKKGTNLHHKGGSR